MSYRRIAWVTTSKYFLAKTRMKASLSLVSCAESTPGGQPASPERWHCQRCAAGLTQSDRASKLAAWQPHALLSRLMSLLYRALTKPIAAARPGEPSANTVGFSQ